MIVPPFSTITRRFQEQKVPVPEYMGTLDFRYYLNVADPGTNLRFGLKSSDGTIRSSYELLSGFVYDYKNRFISTYQSGDNLIEYGLSWEYYAPSGGYTYVNYQKFNDRIISLQEPFVDNYTGKPFDRFYIQNLGSQEVEFDLSIDGFKPATLYSSLSGIGFGEFSGNLWQEAPTSGPYTLLNYGLFGVSIPPDRGTLVSFETNGSGILSYKISGNNLFNGETIPVEFDTYFGKVLRDIPLVTGIEGSVSTPAGGEAVSGISLNLYGPSNLMQAGESLDFFLDYYSNKENALELSLSDADSFATTLLSGFGAGYLTYEGYVYKSGVLYSAKYATGTSFPLGSAPNDIYNTDYSLIDSEIYIEGEMSARSTGTFYEGETTFVFTGVMLTGFYNGPHPGYQGVPFSGLGDITIVQTFVDGDGGEIVYNDDALGYLNPEYSSTFKLAGTTHDTSNASLFPTGAAWGRVNQTLTGYGIMSKEYAIPSFFGYGSGHTANSAISVPSVSATGKVNYKGNAYEWIKFEDGGSERPPFTPTPSTWGGAYCLCESVSAVGKGLVNGALFPVQGAPSPPTTTWGYPTGPSNIVIEPQHFMVVVNAVGVMVEGWLGAGSVSGPPTNFSYTGPATGYFSVGGGTYPGPVFPDPKDTGIYRWAGNDSLRVAGQVYYGRGVMFHSGGEVSAGQQNGIYIEASGAPFEVTFEVTDGTYRGAYVGTAPKGFIGTPIIYPGRLDTDDGSVYTKGPVYLQFPNPEIDTSLTGQPFVGTALVPGTDLGTKFNLLASQTDDGLFTDDFQANGWFTTTQFGHTYNFPAGFQKRFLRVVYSTEDTESFDNVVLSAKAGGETKEINIYTNVASNTGQFD